MHFNKRPGPPVTGMSEGEIIAFFERFQRQRLSDYPRTLENWGKFYPEERIFAGFLEDVRFSPDSLLGSLYGFLGVEASARDRVIRKRIRPGTSDSIPAGVASYLARLYYERLEYLSARFGGYASFWLYCAERLIAEPPEGAVPYPFWETSLWREWLESLDTSKAAHFRDAPLHSGVLSG